MALGSDIRSGEWVDPNLHGPSPGLSLNARSFVKTHPRQGVRRPRSRRLVDLLAALNTRSHLCVPSAQPPLKRPSAPRLHPSAHPPSPPTASPASPLTAFRGAPASSSTTPHIARAAALLASHGHPDAQELFQLISECVREDNVNARVGRAGVRDGGSAGVTAAAVGDDALAGVPSPFDGLRRRAARVCAADTRRRFCSGL
ncbi:hypothetical protein GGX14DRAFT_570629 [Mycena pura]|uniref:Uncharacterized protein n=1 Tax=Mycena pura TaxID=153505 RepID=A0AAD6V4F8_9AGAR|nr:hypothetical protein GGX14DRAFT_570629 [Mycena pura]